MQDVINDSFVIELVIARDGSKGVKDKHLRLI
jgi:CMP-N-acetylneuraminic acid synthetase